MNVNSMNWAWDAKDDDGDEVESLFKPNGQRYRQWGSILQAFTVHCCCSHEVMNLISIIASIIDVNEFTAGIGSIGERDREMRGRESRLAS